MKVDLSGKIAIVTGASKGIGFAVTQALAAEGATVVAGARSLTEELSKLARDAPVHHVPVDLSTVDGPAHLVEAAVSEFGRVDILINNVGAARPRTGGFLSITDEDWNSSWTINFLAPVRTTRAALPHLLAHGDGAIVTVTSVNASLPKPLVMDYGAAKAALTNFSKSLSKEVGPRGVRVNTVSPGPVSTDLWLGADGAAAIIGRVYGAPPEVIAAKAASDSVTGRFSRPEEVADLVLFLASDRAMNVSGAEFMIDGGLTASL